MYVGLFGHTKDSVTPHLSPLLMTFYNFSLQRYILSVLFKTEASEKAKYIMEALESESITAVIYNTQCPLCDHLVMQELKTLYYKQFYRMEIR